MTSPIVPRLRLSRFEDPRLVHVKVGLNIMSDRDNLFMKLTSQGVTLRPLVGTVSVADVSKTIALQNSPLAFCVRTPCRRIYGRTSIQCRVATAPQVVSAHTIRPAQLLPSFTTGHASKVTWTAAEGRNHYGIVPGKPPRYLRADGNSTKSSAAHQSFPGSPSQKSKRFASSSE